MGLFQLMLVESDPDLRDALGEQLDLTGEFGVHRFAAVTPALEAVREIAPSLILLDAAAPDLDGPSAVRAFRATGHRGPIILLTAVDSEADIIRGLDAGANDSVLSKPLRFGVLLARIRAQLRAFAVADERPMQIGQFEFHGPDRVLVDSEGARIRLTDKEAAILRYLCRTGGAVVARETLLHEIWGYHAEVSTHTLETHVYRLRRKIEVDPANARLIVTEDGGYRLSL